jgi:AraC family transcriptional regulator
MQESKLLLRRSAESRRQTTARALAVIAGNLPTRVTRVSVAQACGCSGASLDRLLKKHVGMTVHQVLTAIRLSTALVATVTSDLKFEAVAREVGYRSKKDMYRQYVHRFGVTPGMVRRQRT